VANPGLAPLGNYGGPTQTVALLPGSPAIDRGTDPRGFDQREAPLVGFRDIGAFESQGFTLAVVSGSGQSATVNTPFPVPLVVRVTANNPVEPVAGGVVSFAAPASGPNVTLSGGTATITSNGTYAASASTAGAFDSDSFTPTNVSPSPVSIGTFNGGRALLVNGTDGDDMILVTTWFNNQVKVFVNDRDYGPFAQGSFDTIVVDAKGGNDLVIVGLLITKDAWLYGGNGCDALIGGSGDDVIWGGDDVLIGGLDRDLIIGGTGADWLEGTLGDDANSTALKAIQNEWTSSASYTTVNHLRNGGGLNGAVKLNDTTVGDDGAADSLWGGFGDDWFLANWDSGVRDVIGDASRREFYDEID
jgi:hypothetical protein